MSEMLRTLDLGPGMVVTRGDSVYQVTEVTEPIHPLMPGLVVKAYAWHMTDNHWSPRVLSIHATDPHRKEWKTSERLAEIYPPA